MSLSKLKKDELAHLAEAVGKAAAHHDPADPRSFNIAALQNSVARNPSLGGAIIGEMLSGIDWVKLLEALLSKLLGRGIRPAPDVPGDSAAPTAPAAPSTTPAPAGGVLTVEITGLTVSGPRRNDAETIPFHLDGNKIVLDNGVDALDDGSILNFDAGVMRDGVGIRIDANNNPELMGKIRWEAHAFDGGALIGAIGGSGMDDNAHVDGDVHFLDPSPKKGAGMWRRSGGMSVTAAVRARAEISASIDSSRDSRITPEVR